MQPLIRPEARNRNPQAPNQGRLPQQPRMDASYLLQQQQASQHGPNARSRPSQGPLAPQGPLDGFGRSALVGNPQAFQQQQYTSPYASAPLQQQTPNIPSPFWARAPEPPHVPWKRTQTAPNTTAQQVNQGGIPRTQAPAKGG